MICAFAEGVSSTEGLQQAPDQSNVSDGAAKRRNKHQWADSSRQMLTRDSLEQTRH